MWPPDMPFSDVLDAFNAVLANDAIKGMAFILFALAVAGRIIGLVRSAGE
jgi:hypothetical protein